MKITILAISKKHAPKLEPAILEYSKRLQHYTKLEWKLIEAKITTSMPENEIRESESNLLKAQLNSEDTTILLDERGTELSSPTLSKKLQSYRNHSSRNLVFIIGGAYGVNEDLMKRADFIWSLVPSSTCTPNFSRTTLPRSYHLSRRKIPPSIVSSS